MRKKDSTKYRLNQKLDRKKIFDSIARYCAYQERSESEVRQRLKKYKIDDQEIIDIITKLKEDNFINNERFAKLFASGKFRNNKWGRVKIRYELKRKSIDDKFIDKALESIEGDDYFQLIRKLIETKKKNLVDKNAFRLKNKIANYLFSKGFESELVWQILDEEIH
jgi:regulatory protein